MAGNASNWFKVITGGVKKRIYSDTATLAEMIYTGRESRHPQPTGGSRCQRTWLHYTLLGLHLAEHVADFIFCGHGGLFAQVART